MASPPSVPPQLSEPQQQQQQQQQPNTALQTPATPGTPAAAAVRVSAAPPTPGVRVHTSSPLTSVRTPSVNPVPLAAAATAGAVQPSSSPDTPQAISPRSDPLSSFSGSPPAAVVPAAGATAPIAISAAATPLSPPGVRREEPRPQPQPGRPASFSRPGIISLSRSRDRRRIRDRSIVRCSALTNAPLACDCRCCRLANVTTKQRLYHRRELAITTTHALGAAASPPRRSRRLSHSARPRCSHGKGPLISMRGLDSLHRATLLIQRSATYVCLIATEMRIMECHDPLLQEVDHDSRRCHHDACERCRRRHDAPSTTSTTTAAILHRHRVHQASTIQRRHHGHRFDRRSRRSLVAIPSLSVRLRWSERFENHARSATLERARTRP